MAPDEHVPTDEALDASAMSRVRRSAVYLAALLALAVLAWALIDGGDRDIWNTPQSRALLEISLMRTL